MPCPLFDQGSSWEVEAGSAQGIETSGERALWRSKRREVGFEIPRDQDLSREVAASFPDAETRNPITATTNQINHPPPSTSPLLTVTALEELLPLAPALLVDRDPALKASALFRSGPHAVLSTSCPQLVRCRTLHYLFFACLIWLTGVPHLGTYVDRSIRGSSLP